TLLLLDCRTRRLRRGWHGDLHQIDARATVTASTEDLERQPDEHAEPDDLTDDAACAPAVGGLSGLTAHTCDHEAEADEVVDDVNGDRRFQTAGAPGQPCRDDAEQPHRGEPPEVVYMRHGECERGDQDAEPRTAQPGSQYLHEQAPEHDL